VRLASMGRPLLLSAAAPPATAPSAGNIHRIVCACVLRPVVCGCVVAGDAVAGEEPTIGQFCWRSFSIPKDGTRSQRDQLVEKQHSRRDGSGSGENRNHASGERRDAWGSWGQTSAWIEESPNRQRSRVNYS